jgi:hypothetical protein
MGVWNCCEYASFPGTRVAFLRINGAGRGGHCGGFSKRKSTCILAAMRFWHFCIGGLEHSVA